MPLPSGGLVYAAFDPGWGRVAPDGTLLRTPRPATADFRNTGSVLSVSADGLRLRFQMTAGEPPLAFDVAQGRLDPATGSEAVVPARTTSPRIAVVDWRNLSRPRMGQAALRLDQGEISRSLAILPKEDGFVLGTATHLRLFDAGGRLLDRVGLPGEAWGVAVAANNTVVAALGDGTIRWFAVTPDQRLEERAALFVHADGRRWVIWTPEGLFDHGVNGGQELVGVHLNNGRAQAAEWATFQQAYRALYAPAELRAAMAGDPTAARARIAELGDVRARIAQLPVLKAGSACAVLADGSCPPVTLTGNVVTVPPDSVALRLSLRAEDRGLGFGPLDILVNQRIALRGEPGKGTVDVPLDPGVNSLSSRLYAEDRSLFAEGPAFAVRREGERAPPTEAGRLIVLAIGVDRYANPDLNLGFAVADARGVAEALRTRATGLFREVEAITLTNGDATRAGILRALNEVAARARPEDTFVLYVAGHGIRTERDRRFLFLPADTNDVSTMTAIRANAIEDEVLVAALARIRARDGFLFLDTCHAGQLTVDSLAALGNETGRFLLAASTSVQEALDSYDARNGVFAFAVLEALSGRAAVDGDGRISALAVGEYVSRRVPQLAAEKRHSQNAVFRTAGRDLRGFPLAAVRR
ncbi:caspase family protein [Roseomonas sp. CCTCC AB2023176]|uniref:caspase family protein n=1 Tax=Roseomonas sp. CCTCC AB2023176 TaxID=3342640 RepID=UPI0035D7E64F